jgi:hypothetical protein
MKLKVIGSFIILEMSSSGFIYADIKRFPNESYNNYLERTVFILNNLKAKKLSFDELVQKSFYFHSMKVLKCGYSSETNQEIKNMSQFAGISLEK